MVRDALLEPSVSAAYTVGASTSYTLEQCTFREATFDLWNQNRASIVTSNGSPGSIGTSEGPVFLSKAIAHSLYSLSHSPGVSGITVVVSTHFKDI